MSHSIEQQNTAPSACLEHFARTLSNIEQRLICECDMVAAGSDAVLLSQWR